MTPPLELRSGLLATPFAGHAGLERQADVWRALVDAGGLDPLCNGWDWVRAYARAWVPDGALFGWTLSAPDGAPVAVIALCDEPRRGPLALPRARFVQDGSFDSDYVDVPHLPGQEARVAAALVELATRRRGPQALVLGPFPADSSLLAALRADLDGRGLRTREEPLPCPALELPPDFDGYLGSLRKRMRSKVRQALRRVDERGGRYAWCHEPETLTTHLEGLYDLHARRWNAIGGAGAFEEPRRRAFYADHVPRALAAGHLRFARLELDGAPVAYQLGFEHGGRYYQLQEGYAPELEELRVGTALRAWMIRELIAGGTRAYDFMAGASRHKADWGGVDRGCVTLAAPLPKLRGRLAYAARGLRDRLRERRVGAGEEGQDGDQAP